LNKNVKKKRVCNFGARNGDAKKTDFSRLKSTFVKKITSARNLLASIWAVS